MPKSRTTGSSANGLWPSRANADFRSDDLAHSQQGYRVPSGGDAAVLAAAARDASCNYAILDQLEGFRDVEGKLELKLAWPGADIKPQHWKQRTVRPVRTFYNTKKLK